MFGKLTATKKRADFRLLAVVVSLHPRKSNYILFFDEHKKL